MCRERALAELIVSVGANVQPGQIVAVSTEPGKEALTRAVAEAAYARGALFVDVSVFDPYVKRSRLLHADPETLGYVPPWYGERLLAVAEARGARINLTGTTSPHLFDGIDPALVSRDMLPRLAQSGAIVNARTTNWTIGPAPTEEWAQLVHPELEPDAALARLWDEIAHVCRLDEPDPLAAWTRRLERLAEISEKLTALRLDAVRFDGPGTELTVGLLASSQWMEPRFSTVGGIPHLPNIPTEEVFTSPDPQRAEGWVRSTKPLLRSGAVISGLRVRFEHGRAVEIDADEGAGELRAAVERDAGAARLGEVALVDRDSRIGALGTIFYNTLLDENAASHIALGFGFGFTVDDRDAERINDSEIHIDFMIGSDEVAVTGVAADGDEVPLLRGGTWQI